MRHFATLSMTSAIKSYRQSLIIGSIQACRLHHVQRKKKKMRGANFCHVYTNKIKTGTVKITTQQIKKTTTRGLPSYCNSSLYLSFDNACSHCQKSLYITLQVPSRHQRCRYLFRFLPSCGPGGHTQFSPFRFHLSAQQCRLYW